MSDYYRSNVGSTVEVSEIESLADGVFIVGDGTGAPAQESGNTARTSLGLGTGDSPTFTALTLTGKLTIDNDLEFTGAQSITTTGTTQDLTIAPTGDVYFNVGGTGVGIGTASPATQVEIQDASDHSILTIDHTATNKRGAITFEEAGASRAFLSERGSTIGTPNEFQIGTTYVGGSVVISADNNITNLTLSGASGAETASFSKDLDVVGDFTAGTIASDATITANSNYVLEGYATGRNVVRSLFLKIENATTAGNYVKATGTNQWNASAIGVEDDLLLGTTGTNYFYGRGSITHIFEVLSAGLDGNCIGVLSVTVTRNQSGTDVTVTPSVNADGIKLEFFNATSGSTVDLDSLVDSGTIRLVVTYVTSS